MLEIFLILFFLVSLSAGVVLLKMAWKQMKSGAGLWGVNLRRANCPKCGLRTPLIRRPTSARQALWGGWTCSQCGTEIDKWGTDISASVRSADEQFEFYYRTTKPRLLENERSPLERVFDDSDTEKNEY